jgi:geranylgeranyl pyrophosphate synthase
VKLDEWYSSAANQNLKERVRTEVANAFPTIPRDGVMEWLEHGLKDRHQFRPYLLLALNGVLESDADIDEDLLKFATAIETSHQASLIVDDITDGHDVRGKRRQSLHTRYGDGIAATMSHSFIAVAEKCVHESGFSSEQKIAALKLMTQAKIDMACGQYADVFETEKPPSVSWINWLKEQSYLKTSALMTMPFGATSIIKNLNESATRRLMVCGHALGGAYQVGDDVRDMQPELGKLTLSYPLAVLLDELDNQDLQFVESLVSRGRIGDEAEVNRLKGIVNGERSRILQLAEADVSLLEQQAVSFPNGLSGRFAAQEIIDLVKGIIKSSSS